MSKAKLMAATLAVVAVSAAPAVAQDGNNVAVGGDATNTTGDISQNIDQNNEDINQNAEISAGGTNGGQGDSENNIDQNVSNDAAQYANTGDNVAVGGDAAVVESEDGGFFDFFGFFSGLFS